MGFCLIHVSRNKTDVSAGWSEFIAYYFPRQLAHEVIVHHAGGVVLNVTKEIRSAASVSPKA